MKNIRSKIAAENISNTFSEYLDTAAAAAAEYVEACSAVKVDSEDINEALDAREIVICAMLAEGKTYREIGEALGISGSYAQILARTAVGKAERYPSRKARAAECAERWKEAEQIYAAKMAAICHEDPSTWKDMDLDELKLSARAFNPIRRAGFWTVSDVTSNLSGVHKTRGVGKTVWLELLDALDAFFGIEYYRKNFTKI